MQRPNLRLIFTLSLLLQILAVSRVNAQQGQGTWSLKRCLEYAIETNITLQQSKLVQENNQIALKQVQASRYPSLNANAGYSLRFGRSVNPFTNDFETRDISSINYGAFASVDVFNGFRINNTIKRNALNLEASRLDYEAAVNDLGLNIASAYLSILLSRELLEASRIQLSTVQEQRDRTQKLVNAGTLPQRNLLELESQVATEEANFVTRQNQLNLSMLRLQQLLNLEPSATFQIEVPELIDPGTTIDVALPENIYRYAESTLPEIRSAQIQVQSADLAIQVAKSDRYPSLSFSGQLGSGYASGLNRTVGFTATTDVVPATINGQAVNLEFPGTRPVFEKYGFGSQLNDNFSYGLGASLQIPIYNKRQVQSSIEQSINSRKNASLQEALAKQTLRQTIEQAYLDVQASSSEWQQVNRQIESLLLTFENTQKQYDLGLVNSVDYLLARNNLDVARQNRIRIKYDYIFKSKILDFYQGKPINL